MGRHATEEDKKKENVVLKENDLLSNKRKFFVTEEVKKALIDQLKIDCAVMEKLLTLLILQWLERQKRMDYSLLVGIHKQTPDEKTVSRVKFQPDSPRMGSLRRSMTTIVSHLVLLVPSHVFFCEDTITQTRRRAFSVSNRGPLKSILKKRNSDVIDHTTNGKSQ